MANPTTKLSFGAKRSKLERLVGRSERWKDETTKPEKDCSQRRETSQAQESGRDCQRGNKESSFYAQRKG